MSCQNCGKSHVSGLCADCQMFNLEDRYGVPRDHFSDTFEIKQKGLGGKAQGQVTLEGDIVKEVKSDE